MESWIAMWLDELEAGRVPWPIEHRVQLAILRRMALRARTSKPIGPGQGGLTSEGAARLRRGEPPMRPRGPCSRCGRSMRSSDGIEPVCRPCRQGGL